MIRSAQHDNPLDPRIGSAGVGDIAKIVANDQVAEAVADEIDFRDLIKMADDRLERLGVVGNVGSVLGYATLITVNPRGFR